MADPLEYFRQLCRHPSDAIRWSCVLEATSPKAGNVYPGQEFGDLSYLDFITAAEIAAKHLADSTRSYAQRILDCVQATQTTSGTNVNLGILLLLGPLVAADQSAKFRSSAEWSPVIARQLDLGPQESRLIFQAISESSPGGLGTVSEMDVQDQQSHEDIIAAMRLAKHRDRVARQYADGFDDLINNVLPVLYHSIVESADVLRGIAVAHLRLLAETPDTLIARKSGELSAKAVQERAARVEVSDFNGCLKFDRSLRSDDHHLNPGTTADLIAGALYVLLRTPTRGSGPARKP